MKFRSLFLLTLLIFSLNSWAQKNSSQESSSVLGSLITSKPKYNREMVLGSILKGALENLHLSNKIIDNDLSEKAFKIYLERIDYGKQFLLQSDVNELSTYKDRFDDELISGDLTIIDKTTELLNSRLKLVESFALTALSGKMDFNAKETLETDPKKRTYARSERELKNYWQKLMKLEVLSRMAEIKDEQDGTQTEAQKKKNKSKPKREKKLSNKEIEQEAREKVQKSYKRIFTRLKEEERSYKLDKFYNSITKVFDPHTNYLIPDDKADFDIDMSGKLEGIGAILREDNSYIKVERVVPGSAAWKTKKLEAEDTILKVGQGKTEPIDVVDMPLRDAVKLIRGKKGSEVRLTVKKPDGQVIVIPIIRDVVEIEESYVKSTVLELSPLKTKVGYINVPKFYRDFNDAKGRNCSEDTKKEIQRLEKEGIKALILDLRNNGGGALEDARLISGLFIEKGPIVQVKANSGKVDVLTDTDKSIYFKKPLIVLINRFSASASEIVAAALQDYGRAIVVGGEFSHGKGTVQAVVDLDGYVSPMAKSYSPLGALKITIQKFYRINGSSTQFKGVTPDIILPDQYSHLESGEKFLDYAIPWGEVKPVKFDKWKSYRYDLKKIKQESSKRIAKSAKFKHVGEIINWYGEQKDKTERSLNVTDFEKNRNEIKEKTEIFKKEDENENLLVKNLSPSKEKSQQERFEEFAKELKKDPTIEESIYIIEDVLKDLK